MEWQLLAYLSLDYSDDIAIWPVWFITEQCQETMSKICECLYIYIYN